MRTYTYVFICLPAWPFCFVTRPVVYSVIFTMTVFVFHRTYVTNICAAVEVRSSAAGHIFIRQGVCGVEWNTTQICYT